MKHFALIGYPLGHSLSPLLHGYIAKETGLDFTYTLHPILPDQVPDFIHNLAKSGIDGLNVTIPHKLSALASVDGLSQEAQEIGAVNTVQVTAYGNIGHNTDYYGFGAMLRHAGISFAGKNALVLGSGGSARAVVAYLADHGAGQIYMASRNRQEAAILFPQVETVEYDEIHRLHGGVIVNCTPVGMSPHVDACPLQDGDCAGFEAVADLVYNPRRTRLIALAQRMGQTTSDGLYMLVAQAVQSQRIWQNIDLSPSVEEAVYQHMSREMNEPA